MCACVTPFFHKLQFSWAHFLPTFWNPGNTQHKWICIGTTFMFTDHGTCQVPLLEQLLLRGCQLAQHMGVGIAKVYFSKMPHPGISLGKRYLFFVEVTFSILKMWRKFENINLKYEKKLLKKSLIILREIWRCDLWLLNTLYALWHRTINIS